MISACPECETEMRSNICACGYRLPDRVLEMPDYLPDPLPARNKKDDGYRRRWYAERGLPYEPANTRPCPPFRCVGGRREPGSDC